MKHTAERQVNIIFHVAASVNLEERLMDSVKANVGGTISVVDLAKSCKNLAAVVHVSTAYCNCNLKNIEEKIYVPPILHDQHLEMSQILECVLNMEKRILREWPNAYVVAKNMAEYVVATRGKDIPACVFRPAIITNTAKEPLRGYVNNYHGTNGVLANALAGTMRTAHFSDQTNLENVPADFVVNAMIVAAQKTFTLGCGNFKTYNFVSSPDNKIGILDFLNLTLVAMNKTPTIKSFGYPMYTINPNKYAHFLYTVFLHYVPAILFDCYLRIWGKKPWMFSYQKKIYKFNCTIAFFTMNDWKFASDNVQQLWNEMSQVDKEIFPFDMSKSCFDWKEYVKYTILGIRLYLLKDELETLPRALLKNKKLYYLYYGLKYAALGLLIAFVVIFMNYIFE